MNEQDLPYQPGAILHAAVLGAFKARGTSFEAWCAAQGIKASAGRNVTYGQSKGSAGRALLARMIEDAGPDVVRAAYVDRLNAHTAAMKGRVA